MNVGVGDQFPVMLEEHQVAIATVEDIDGKEAILRIPETVIVMGISSRLAELERNPETSRIIIEGGTPEIKDEE